MTGYREHSFNPSAGERSGGPPMRPFNWVQWTGVAFVVIAIAVDLAYVGSAFGWWPKIMKTPVLSTTPLIFGMMMITSRRQSIVDPAPELAAARRKWLVIVFAVCAVILGVATIFAMKGY
jgi:hypothetical protein